jgi:hypothetical protein
MTTLRVLFFAPDFFAFQFVHLSPFVIRASSFIANATSPLPNHELEQK